MEIRRINDDFSVAGQINAADVSAVAKAGFRSLVCNRPDSEEGAAPHEQVGDAARAAGLEFRFLPVVSGAITPENVDDMAKALKQLPSPVLAYCRTGGRCTNLHMLVQQHTARA